jgi:hypothetical protein
MAALALFNPTNRRNPQLEIKIVIMPGMGEQMWNVCIGRILAPPKDLRLSSRDMTLQLLSPTALPLLNTSRNAISFLTK